MKMATQECGFAHPRRRSRQRRTNLGQLLCFDRWDWIGCGRVAGADRRKRRSIRPRHRCDTYRANFRELRIVITVRIFVPKGVIAVHFSFDCVIKMRRGYARLRVKPSQKRKFLSLRAREGRRASNPSIPFEPPFRLLQRLAPAARV